jgi:hypothetical protein
MAGSGGSQGFPAMALLNGVECGDCEAQQQAAVVGLDDPPVRPER